MSRRVALVTGAARGMGAEISLHLAGQGYDVLAVDWCAGADARPYPMPTTDDLDAVAADPRGHGRVVTRVVDVRDPTAMTEAVTDALDRWGRLDAAVAAAGIVAGGSPLWETPVEQLDLLWQVDTLGVWHTAAATVPAMLAGPDPSGCRFVAIASVAGGRGLLHLAAYTAAKHAVVGIVRGLAADLVGTGVTAVAVSPGSTSTRMLDATAALYGVANQDLAAHQLLHRPLDPTEIAATVALCCSPEGAALNGGVIAADGGFSG